LSTNHYEFANWDDNTTDDDIDDFFIVPDGAKGGDNTEGVVAVFEFDTSGDGSWQIMMRGIKYDGTAYTAPANEIEPGETADTDLLGAAYVDTGTKYVAVAWEDSTNDQWWLNKFEISPAFFGCDKWQKDQAGNVAEGFDLNAAVVDGANGFDADAEEATFKLFSLGNGLLGYVWEEGGYAAGADVYAQVVDETTTTDADIIGWPLYTPIDVPRPYGDILGGEQANPIVSAFSGGSAYVVARYDDGTDQTLNVAKFDWAERADLEWDAPNLTHTGILSLIHM